MGSSLPWRTLCDYRCSPAHWANAIGDYSGQTLLRGTPGERMFIGVQADGPWTIQISAIEVDPNAVRFSGRGDAVSGIFTPPAQGPVPYVFSHDGQRNFIVWARCGDSLLDDSLAQNLIGPASGSAVVSFRGGPCVWEVQADGNWSIAPQ